MSATAARRKATDAARIDLAPFALRDAPSFIERQFPVGRLSAEAYKERKAGAGQTLTALGSYWKGRKPLVLVRAVVLGCLLPATNDPVKDLDVFLKLMAMDDGAFLTRLPLRDSDVAAMAIEAGAINERDLPTHFRMRQSFLKRLGREEPVEEDWPAALEARALVLDTDEESERRLRLAALSTLTYDERVQRAKRPEECDEAELYARVWPEINAHLGTETNTLAELVEQLGIARFGHRAKVADTFCGAGSIPFEAARLGCDVYASDLNPIACMLTWAAFNILGADEMKRAEIEAAQHAVAEAVDAEITRLGIEHDNAGNRAKVFLYCLETRCPKTGWIVPMAPSWIISKTRNVIATLVPDKKAKRYEIEIHTGVSEEQMEEAALGTVRDGRLIHPMNPEKSGVDIRTIRGDYKDAEGNTQNRLRRWEREDFMPRPDDILRDRLYCIQWMSKGTLSNTRPESSFASVTNDDLARERKMEGIVREKLHDWQNAGLVPNMLIDPGEKTDEPIRTRGWTHWSHLFAPRHLLILAILRSKLSGRQIIGSHMVQTVAGNSVTEPADLCITDPPYADAVSYHEITEFFIAWLRKNPPPPFDQWTWDSQRKLAIKGKDEEFRRAMVDAYAAMTRHMADNGVQVVMFTHQDAGVWADLGAILWAAGLRVVSAWNVATETTSALKDGNYVQGTICLVLRKRLGHSNARRMEIEAEIEDAVRAQLNRLTALGDEWLGEVLYTDGDLTLAAYAAALQVVTAYSSIDRQTLDRDLYRKLAKGERSALRELIDYAAQVANGILVPEGFPREMWRDLDAPSRFYVRMLDMEDKGAPKLSAFQDFAKETPQKN
jgi:putative DNA methylase